MYAPELHAQDSTDAAIAPAAAFVGVGAAIAVTAVAYPVAAGAIATAAAVARTLHGSALLVACLALLLGAKVRVQRVGDEERVAADEGGSFQLQTQQQHRHHLQSQVTSCMSHVTSHGPHVTRLKPQVTRHQAQVTGHRSPVDTRHGSLTANEQR